jgi:hypothetical protein
MQGEDDDDNTICKKFFHAVREVEYARRKREWNIGGFIVGMVLVFATFGFLAHTYYIRHRDKALKEHSTPYAAFDYDQAKPNLPHIS